MESARLRRIDSNRSPAQALVQVSKRRPRASGGHPHGGRPYLPDAVSSPRERGSSSSTWTSSPIESVVPARAGVIRHRDPVCRRRARRPRASGGHPGPDRPLRRGRGSSPRERGSSAMSSLVTAASLVVPARAGVILWPDGRRSARIRRPRASGGHPRGSRYPRLPHASSPRERGSSSACAHRRVARVVVPARAGVIRLAPCGGWSGARRPRASGGHPRRPCRS